MVLLAVKIKCDLENLTNLQPEDLQEFRYYFKLQCTSCREVSPRESSVTLSEKVENQKGSKVSDFHLQQKCDFCKRSGTITIIEGHNVPYTSEASEEGKFLPLVFLECRGMEPIEFIPKDGWKAEGVESGTKFPDIDLSEGDFSEYDEKAQSSVGIYEFQSEIVKTKL